MARTIAEHLAQADKLEVLRAEIAELNDRMFLEAGGSTNTVCAIATWHWRQWRHGPWMIEGSVFCATRCSDGTCASTRPCKLFDGNTEGCVLACDCVCALSWDTDAWPTERLAKFRRWVDRQFREMIKDCKDKAKAIGAGMYHVESRRIGGRL